MELFQNLALGFGIALTLTTLSLAIIGCILGTIIGALPGLGPSNGVAILIPLAFTLELDATQALVLMTSVYYGAMYGGRISSILLNIPGDEPAMMTTLDGYPMAKKGRAGDALVLSGVSSFVGAFLATIGLMLLAPILARVAFYFGPAEYFALYLLAFCTLGGIGAENQAKSAIAVCLGLGISMIGVDNSTGMTRFTGGNLHLYDGVDFLVAIVGLFAVTEIFVFIESRGKESAIGVKLGKISIPFKDIIATRWTMLRATIVGFIAGVLPGAGASLGSFLAYMSEKSLAKEKKTFGTGDIRGVAAPEAGNNAAAGGALVPMLTLGIPGSATTAVILTGLIIHGVRPGPDLFKEQPEFLYGIFGAMLVANILFFIFGFFGAKIFARITLVPNKILWPMIFAVSVCGTYSLSQSIIDVWIMLFFGVLGFFMRRYGFSVVPVIIGLILGELVEGTLRQSIVIFDGNWLMFLTRPIALTFFILSLIALAFPLIRSKKNKKII